MIIQVYDDDLLNGEGIREVVFLQGCPHHCKGCFSPETWKVKEDTKESLEKDHKFLLQVEHKLSQDYIKGLTISGGDPFYKPNLQMTAKLILLAQLYRKNVWVYTGYSFNFIKKHYLHILKDVDVLCDGEFISSLKSPNKPWVGSSNQRVIDVKKSLKQNKIVLYENGN